MLSIRMQSTCSVLAALLGCATALPIRGAARDCAKEPAGIYEKTSPGVVFIYATSINPYRINDRVEHAVGSGFIIRGDGLVLTNSHVAFGKQSLLVKLDDGESLPAHLLGADPIFDLAVLQVQEPDGAELPTLTLGDSDQIRVGDEVFAIGNPLGLGQSMTRGIISGVNRIVPETYFSLQEPMIQVDTPINHGDSGGPLLDRCGAVVGITTAIVPDAQDIGLVISINLAKSLVPTLLQQGRIVRPWLGFHGQFVDDRLKGLLKLPLETGLLVEAIEPGSPAEKAGLHDGNLEITVAGDDFLLGGDIVTAMNGQRLDTEEKANAALRPLKVGTEVQLTVFREGRSLEMGYTLPERPLLPGDLPGQASATAALRSRTASHAPARARMTF